MSSPIKREKKSLIGELAEIDKQKDSSVKVSGK
jgi:hypothetical protein